MKNEVKKDTYIDMFKEINIFCKKCGKYFSVTPINHLAGQGCTDCYPDAIVDPVELKKLELEYK